MKLNLQRIFAIALILICLSINPIQSVQHLRHSRHHRQHKLSKLEIQKSLAKKVYQRSVKISGGSYKIKGVNDVTLPELQGFLNKYSKYIGVTETEVKQIADGLNPGQYVIFRPVNPGIVDQINLKTAVGKGMNVHGKSSKLDGINGMVPVEQKFSKTEKAEEIAAQDKDNKHSLEEGEKKFKAATAPGAKCNYAQISNIVGKTKINLAKEIIGKGDTKGVKEVEVMGYYQFDKQCKIKLDKDGKTPLVKPVVADYDILVIGDCNGLAEDKVMGDSKFKDVLDLATKASPTDDDKKKLNDLVKELNVAQNSPDITNENHADMGFAPKQSFKIIKTLIDNTAETGVVRHSAEIYNYVFSQRFTTEPHLFLRRNADDANKKRVYKTDIILTKTPAKTDDEIKKQINTEADNGGADSQLALVDYLTKMSTDGCKCIPINLLWTSDAKKFKVTEWKGFASSHKAKIGSALDQCPLYKNYK